MARHIKYHFKNILTGNQHGFVSGKSTVTDPIELTSVKLAHISKELQFILILPKHFIQ